MKNNDVIVVTMTVSEEMEDEKIAAAAKIVKQGIESGILKGRNIRFKLVHGKVLDPLTGKETYLLEIKGRSTNDVDALRKMLLAGAFEVCVDAIIPHCS